MIFPGTSRAVERGTTGEGKEGLVVSFAACVKNLKKDNTTNGPTGAFNAHNVSSLGLALDADSLEGENVDTP